MNCSLDPTKRQVRICWAPVHSTNDATSTLVTKLSPSNAYLPDYAKIDLKALARSGSVFAGCLPSAVKITIMWPSGMSIRRPFGDLPNGGHRSPVAWSSVSYETRRQVPIMELSLLLRLLRSGFTTISSFCALLEFRIDARDQAD